MPAIVVDPLIESIRENAFRIAGESDDFDPLLDYIGDSRLVLLGEASHGTHEFYRTRADITRRLIDEKGFTAVAVEADWPDAYRVNRYVQFRGDDRDGSMALLDFERFPTWMWRNRDVLEFVEWLRSRNGACRNPSDRVGFYGIDLYSLGKSMASVLAYLDRVDPAAAERARYRYSCFDQFAEDSHAYGYAASMGLAESCEREVVNQLIEMQRKSVELARRDGRIAADEFFFAEQNARLVKNAEQYYRTMFHDQVESWNLRDRHMLESLEALLAHLGRDGPAPKVVLWAHNSHLGDARATQMSQRGELNVGQLVRERFGDAAALIGFTTYTGTVTAAADWDRPAEIMRVRSALRGSYEHLFHEAGMGDFYLLLSGGDMRRILARERLERAIGVVYRPATERLSHYFDASLSSQFDAVIHFDNTSAVQPLERIEKNRSGDADETFPSGN